MEIVQTFYKLSQHKFNTQIMLPKFEKRLLINDVTQVAGGNMYEGLSKTDN